MIKALLCFVLITSSLLCEIISIDINGTMDFTSIQEAINDASNGDSLIVYPGRYYENIDFLGKNLVVCSLFLTTGINSYINQTVIDGNQEGSVVKVISGEEIGTTICGFTIRNGSGNEIYEGGQPYGGGTYIKNSSLKIADCIIKDNRANAGGGIACYDSNLELSNNLITQNRAEVGGGIFFIGVCNVSFDPQNRCDIFLNYAGQGNEIQKAGNCPPINVFVDTFTVNNPDSYFIQSTTSVGEPLFDVTLNNLNAKIEPVNSDLYVSVDGSNSNSGLNSGEPLASINYALSLIDADSEYPKTIYIAEGTYTRINQAFPLCMRKSISIQGDSMENTILDAENMSGHIMDTYSGNNSIYSIKNMSLENCDEFNAHSLLINSTGQYETYVRIENVKISENMSHGFSSITTNSVHLELENILISDNETSAITFYNSMNVGDTLFMNNVRIINNVQNTEVENSNVTPISIGGLGTNSLKVIMSNVEITNNENYTSDWPRSINAIRLGDNIDLYLINSTLGDNQSPGYGGSLVLAGDNTSATIINSIIYGNTPHQIYIDNNQSNSTCSLTILNSLIDGGQEDIQNPYSFNEVFWMDGNLDENPLWTYSGDLSYSLLDTSPCIDAGTMDLPNGIEIPEYDLGGNPRVYGETIDMGCYEWQGTGSMNDELPIANYKLCNYPNPFNPETTIEFSLSTESELLITIYNIKGQLVKTLLNSNIKKGKHQITWTGKNESGIEVSSGIYYCRLKSDNMETVRKMILIK